MATYTEHYNLKKPQPSEYYAIADFNGNADVIDDELFKKVDKVAGKGLSTNDYTDADKAIVGGVTSALADKVDKVTGKGLSTNDYDNTAKGIVDGVTSALAGKVSTSSVGSANGVAELDANGKVPSSQLPSYVDDTVEGYLNSVDGKFYADSSYTTEITGETGKIYVTRDTNKTYRWSGSGFVEISESLALGETSSTAYAGDKGKANADAIAAMKDGTNIDSFGDVETALAGKANSSDLGDKSNLTTTDKSSVVAAINEVNSGLINYFTNLIAANAISVANTAKAGTTIARAELRHDRRFAELVINITNENTFDTGDTGVMLNIDWSKTGVSFDGFKSACGTCNNNASYPDFARAGAISSWTLLVTGEVYMRISESGIKAARLCTVFKLAW